MRTKTLSVLMLIASTAAAHEAGDVTMPFNLGTSLYSHRFAAYGKSASDTNVGDRFVLSQFVGAGYFVSSRVRLGMNLQIGEDITNPYAAPASRLAIFGFLPMVNINLWRTLTFSVVPTFLCVYEGLTQFAFNVQAVLAASVPLKNGFALNFAVEVPVYVYPVVSIGITPLIGFVYGFHPGRRRTLEEKPPAQPPTQQAGLSPFRF